MVLRVGVQSTVGLIRQTNEDSYLVREGLYVVCDGMGGARAGEIASEMACRGMLSLHPVEAGTEELLQAVREVNLAIATLSLHEHDMQGMGTTLTGALVRRGLVTIVHAGDSRAYLFHDGNLRQLTDDHSWVGAMMRRGELTPAEAAAHPHRSVITKALGTDNDVEPDVVEAPFVTGDRLLLCSDGLSGMVSDAEIAEILGLPEDPQTLASLLVRAALLGGGEDNATVIVVEALPDEEGGGPAIEDPSEPVIGPMYRGVPKMRPAGIGFSRGRRSAVLMRDRLGKTVGSLKRHSAATVARAEDARRIPPARRPGEPAASSGESLHSASVEAAPRRRRRRWVVLALAVVVVIAMGIGGFSVFNSTVYYVGRSEGGVALYRGLPGSILGIDLSRVIERGSVPYDYLAPYIQSRIDARDLLTKEEGQNFLRSLQPMP